VKTIKTQKEIELPDNVKMYDGYRNIVLNRLKELDKLMKHGLNDENYHQIAGELKIIINGSVKMRDLTVKNMEYEKQKRVFVNEFIGIDQGV